MLKLIKSSILDVHADVVVMSAHPSLLAGSGISGVIHKAAGPELEGFAKPLGPLKVGQAVLTPSFNLKAKYIVHSVCPRFYDGLRGEAPALRAAYANALSATDEIEDAESIAFVSMGTGVYRWPVLMAARIAVSELSKSRFDSTFMCLTDESIFFAYEHAMTESQ